MIFNLCVHALAAVGETQTPTSKESAPAHQTLKGYSADYIYGLETTAK